MNSTKETPSSLGVFCHSFDLDHAVVVKFGKEGTMRSVIRLGSFKHDLHMFPCTIFDGYLVHDLHVCKCFHVISANFI